MVLARVGRGKATARRGGRGALEENSREDVRAGERHRICKEGMEWSEEKRKAVSREAKRES